MADPEGVRKEVVPILVPNLTPRRLENDAETNIYVRFWEK